MFLVEVSLKVGKNTFLSLYARVLRCMVQLKFCLALLDCSCTFAFFDTKFEKKSRVLLFHVFVFVYSIMWVPQLVFSSVSFSCQCQSNGFQVPVDVQRTMHLPKNRFLRFIQFFFSFFVNTVAVTDFLALVTKKRISSVARSLHTCRCFWSFRLIRRQQECWLKVPLVRNRLGRYRGLDRVMAQANRMIVKSDIFVGFLRVALQLCVVFVYVYNWMFCLLFVPAA